MESQPAHKFSIRQIPGVFGVVRLDAGSVVPLWASSGIFSAVVRSSEEVSLVCDQAQIPPDVLCDRDWVALKVEGPMALSLTGVLSSLISPLASRGIAVFVLSTFDTDYILVKQSQVLLAEEVLRGEGHQVS
jgi:hypothetical protein